MRDIRSFPMIMPSLSILPTPSALPIRSEAEISEAIRECASHCLANDIDAKEYVDSFAYKLRKMGWAELDSKQVQVGTLHVLSYLRKDDSLLPTRE